MTKFMMCSFVFLLLTIPAAIAQNDPHDNCGIIDSTPPELKWDSSRPTGRTHFDWITDANDWQHSSGSSIAEHSLFNRHDRPLSAFWEKAGILFKYNDPLLANRCAEQGGRTIGPSDKLYLELDAPIFTPNDGEKLANAYVFKSDLAQDDIPTDAVNEKNITKVSEANDRITGVEIWANFRDGEEVVQKAGGYLLASYSVEKSTLTVTMQSGDKGEKLAFDPSGFGLKAEKIQSRLSEVGIEAPSIPLEKIVAEDELTMRAFGRHFQREFLYFPLFGEELTFSFVGVNEFPAESTPVLLFSPNGELLVSKEVTPALLYK